MHCVICLDASADARRVCGCSARVCRRCLVELLDRGKDKCVACGTRWRAPAVVNACRQALENVDDDHDRARRYMKLAAAYSTAGRPRKSLHMLAKAKKLHAPGPIWDHYIKLESASNFLDIGSTAKAEKCLLGIVHVIPEMTEPISTSSGVLYSRCCWLLCKVAMQYEQLALAKSWVQRAMDIQGQLGLEWQLGESLQLDAQILRMDGKFEASRESLAKAERIMLRCETDEGLICSVKIDLAIAELQLGQWDSARPRLLSALSTLRKRKRDRFSARLLPIAAAALSHTVRPTRRLRRKTWLEKVEYCLAS